MKYTGSHKLLLGTGTIQLYFQVYKEYCEFDTLYKIFKINKFNFKDVGRTQVHDR